MNLAVFYHEENRSYDDTYKNIYATLDGTLRPLTEISFATQEVWHTIEIYPIQEPVVIMLDGEPQDENRTATRIDEDPRALVVFAPREIGMGGEGRVRVMRRSGGTELEHRQVRVMTAVLAGV